MKSRFIEPMPVEDDLCTALGAIEDLGFGARFVLYSEQTCFESGSRVRVVKRKIVLPDEAIIPGLMMTFTFLARRGGRGIRWFAH